MNPASQNLWSTEQTQDVLLLCSAVGAFLARALEDGKISIMEMPAALSLIGPAQKALEGINQVPMELLDLTSDEFDNLVAMVQREFPESLTTEHAAAVATGAANMARGLVQILTALRDRKASLRVEILPDGSDPSNPVDALPAPPTGEPVGKAVDAPTGPSNDPAQ